jgi:hypothetical protein
MRRLTAHRYGTVSEDGVAVTFQPASNAALDPALEFRHAPESRLRRPRVIANSVLHHPDCAKLEVFADIGFEAVSTNRSPREPACQ